MSRLMSFRQFLENTPQEFKNISELKKSGPELELEKLLQAHDWFFTYSSDHRDWKKGKKEYEKIQELIKEAKEDCEPISAGMASRKTTVTVFGNDMTETLASHANAMISMGGALAAAMVIATISISILMFLFAAA